MTQLFILFVNIIVLCISGHIWKGLKSIYNSKGLRASLPYGVSSVLLLGSGTAMANTFLLQVAEISQAAP